MSGSDSTQTDGSTDTATQKRTLRVGLRAEPQLGELADRVADDLREALERRFSGIEWQIEPGQDDAKDPQAPIADLVQQARRHMLDHGWDALICLTDLPLRSDDHRPLTAVVSPTEGVALISVPALGALDIEERVRDAMLDAIVALVGADEDGEDGEDARGRLQELASSVSEAQIGDDDTIRFTSAVIRGNLRLLVGMVRANHPWRVAVKLSRALAAALGTAAYVLASSGFWTLASHMTVPRLLGLTICAIVVASAALLWAHDLWERSASPRTRERVILFNAATTLTIVIGVLTLYVALLVFSVVGSFSLIPRGALQEQIRSSDPSDYLRLAWLAASLATLAGALGSLVEGDLAVREAAYGYRPSRRDRDEESAT
ncbi:MAG: hypothetical protein QOG15_3671 [Solirubrobacteraceae bacterium]|jgi:hypothetical protein|nr:hypothetical protein [Solirubrobacteraceae bacterium]